MTTDRFDVFLSYARADDAGADSAAYDDPARSFMRRLYAALTDAGFRVWWDKVHLPARGEEFTAEIERAIRACDRFILVCGPGAAASAYVRAEYLCALRLCKPITPLLLRGDYGVIPAEMGIDAIHAIDCRPPRGEAAAFADAAARLRQDAPLGGLFGVRRVPDEYIERRDAYASALEALRADAIRTTVISAPAKVVSAPQSAVAVFGMGGVGKSVLAAALAHDCGVRRHFHHGVIWLTVGQTPSVPALQAVVGAHFGDDPTAYDEQGGAVRLSRMLHDKQALIVLDDVWDHRLVERFPVHDTACRLLITTRSSALAGKVQGADVRLGVLTPQEGAALIAARTGRGDPADATYQTISARLGGHTLAVALAAAQIASGFADDAADMLRLIEKRFAGDDPFADLKLDEMDKDQNLAVSLGLSYDALPSDDLRRRLRALGVFAREGTFERAALAAVWGDADPDAARAPVAALRGAGLLEDAADGRFALHNLIHAYARALLLREGEMEAVSARHFARYAALHGEGRDHTDIDYLRGITPDFDNLRAALEWGFVHQPEAACDLLSALSNYLGLHQPPDLRGILLRAGLAAAERVAYARGEANTLRALGDLAMREADYPGARARYTAALALFQAIPDRLGEANTLKALGDLAMMEADYPGARARYTAALALFQAIPDRLGEANTLRALGDLAMREADYPGARARYTAALALFQAIPDRLGEANTLQALGDLAMMEADYPGARARYTAALALFQAIPARLGEANTLKALGDLAMREADYPGARARYTAALALFQAIPDRLGEANTLKALGDLAMREADYPGARARYTAALALFQAIPDRLGEANTLKALGDLAMREDDYPGARARYTAALALFQAIPDRLGEANTLQALGDLAMMEADYPGARARYTAALALFQAIPDRLGEANTLQALGDLAMREADYPGARARYTAALALFQAIPDRLGEANTLQALGDLARMEADYPGARARYTAALALFQAIPDRLGEANTLRALGDLAMMEDDYPGARARYTAALALFQAIPDRLGEANTLMGLGDLMVAQKLWADAIHYYQQTLPMARAIPDRLGTANILYDYGLALFETGRRDEGIAALRECLVIFQAIDPNRWGRNAQRRLDDLLRRAGLSSEPAPPDPQADVIAALLGLYQQGGEAAVRAALADANVPEEVMAALLADLAQRAAGAPPGGGVSTLPAETVQTLAGNTTAVRTDVPDKLAEWRAALTDVRADWAGRGADWAIEVAFADALLAICDGARPTLPPDNPYADVVRQVLAVIDGWRG